MDDGERMADDAERYAIIMHALGPFIEQRNAIVRTAERAAEEAADGGVPPAVTLGAAADMLNRAVKALENAAEDYGRGDQS